MTWNLQDDSGGYQHFSGIATPDGREVRFRQTDPGGVRNGLLVRTAAEECTAANLQERYGFTMSGSIVPVAEGETKRSLSAKGGLEKDSHQHFRIALDGQTPYSTEVAVAVDGDCMVQMDFALPEGGDAPVPVTLRGILVDSGKQILAIQTDPGAVVSARFTGVRSFPRLSPDNQPATASARCG